jgi:hypothetical protein
MPDPAYDDVATVTREGLAFVERHQLNEVQKAIGGLAWGLTRAILECPDHPGQFRRPLDREWIRLVCPVDGTTWDRPADNKED